MAEPIDIRKYDFYFYAGKGTLGVWVNTDSALAQKEWVHYWKI